MMKYFQNDNVSKWLVKTWGRKRARHAMVVVAGSVLVASTAMAFVLSASTYSRSVTAPSKAAIAAAVVRPALSPARKAKPQASPLEGELITLRPYGFEPAEITRPAGPFVLAIENRSQLASLALELTPNSGASLLKSRPIELAMPQGKPQLDNVLDLTPGQYVLTAADHPEWICTITIVSQ